jgi:hypothetical protein
LNESFRSLLLTAALFAQMLESRVFTKQSEVFSLRHSHLGALPSVPVFAGFV